MGKEEIRLLLHKEKGAGYPINSQGAGRLTIPVTMMVPGVHCGSLGCLLHTEDGLKAYVEQWEGKPVTIGHPQDASGNYISANNEGVSHVGFIKNVHYDNGLKADVVIEIDRLDDAYASLIEAGAIVDVSIGAYTEVVFQAGEWNGEQYNGITISYVPDHLAVLFDERGACSISDGCGLNVNQNKQEVNEMNELNEKQLKELNEKGFAVYSIASGESLMDALSAIRNYVYQKDTNIDFHYVQDVFDDAFVYERITRQGNGEIRMFYKQAYEFKGGQLIVIGEPVQVMLKKMYEPLNVNMEEQKMNEKKCCEQKVIELINNAATNFTMEDKEWLQQLNEEQLKKLLPKEVQIQVNADMVKNYLKDKSLEQVAELLSGDAKKELEISISTYKEKRAGYEALVLNSEKTKNIWSKEEIEAMDFGMLEKLAKTVETAVYTVGEKNGMDELPVLKVN